MRFIYVFILLPFITFAQNCNICPAGTVNLTSTFPPTATHLWTCTNGFTSSFVNPTFAPTSSTTCNLLVTDGSGCTATSQTIITVCDCSCNDPCVSMSYNSTTDCVTFNNIGSNCSPTSTDLIEWKNQNTSYATISNGGQICNCNIKEYVNTSASCTVVSTNFRLNILGLQNRCATCSGSNMRIDFQFPLTGSTSSFPGCAATDDWLTISPATFATNGYVCDAYVRYTTPFGVVVNQYRYQYNGGGLNASNVTVTQIAKRSIYKDITARRTVTYTDGCPQEQCEITLDIPQQPNDPCTHFVAFVSNVNLGTPCSGAGFSASTINATGTVTYQWYYNGTLLSGQTSQFFCLVGQPFGTYCVQITDAAGCTENVCRVYQASCNLTASITSSGNILTAVLTGCVGTATYQWQRWNGTTYVNVGTNSSSYNTGGLGGDYRVNVTCSGPPVCNAIAYYTFTPPCTADVTITTGTNTLTANVTGCGGTNITYLWERWNGTSWVTVQTTTTTSTSNVYTPTLSGLYRVTITCNGCSDQAQTSWTAINPCTGFSTTMTGTFTNMCVGDTRTFGRTTTGGTAPFTQVWTVNGLGSGTGTTLNYTANFTGTVAIAVTVTDANGCVFTDTRNITVIQCCGMTLSISPTTATVCTNQDATFTVTPTGGTAPYTYNWTYNIQPSGPVIGAGSGNPKTFNLSTAGTYNVVCTVTDAVGCQVSIFAILTVNTCTNCTCTPSLTLAGCILTGSFAGAGCGNFTYQLQYSPTGTGWSVVASGTASNGGSFTHTPTANGIYRLVIVAGGCTLQQTADVSVNCYTPTCSNPPTLTLNGTSSTTCMTNPVTVSGNTFGGSATIVNLTHNGLGTLTPTSTSTTPFSFTYTPSVSDIGQTRTITVTTNNPLGSPCIPQTRLYEIIVNQNPIVTITSSNSALCVGESRSLTGTPAGGTWSVTGQGTLSGSSVLATAVGTITVTYMVTANGCTGSSSQTITSNATPTAPTATVSCINGTGTITVTAPTGAGYEYSINGTTWQSGTSFAGLSNNTYTLYVRLNGCQNSTTVSVNCQSCACTASIAVTSNCTMSLTQSCTGYTWTWQESTNGTTGWTTVQTNGNTYTGISGRFYRVVLTKASCTDVTTNILNPVCPCQGLALSVTPVTGGVTFGQLTLNGVNQNNYQIEWRRCSDNTVIFTSGMGTGSGSGIYPHPPSSNVPLVGDCYYPFIVFSPQGNSLNCFPQFTVANWTCANPPTYSYNGTGGAASTREFRMDIAASTTIRIGEFSTLVVPDLLEIIYNGVTLYSSSRSFGMTNYPSTIPITYVTGVNYVTFRVTNSNPASNTIWNLSNVSCCPSIICPSVSNIPPMTSVTATLSSTTCGCSFVYTYGTGNLACSGCGNVTNLTYSSEGACVWQQVTSNSTCVNETVVISKPTAASRLFDFTNSSEYNAVKSLIQSATGDQRVRLQFHTFTCGNDGTFIEYSLLPNHHTIVFDDVNFTILVTVSATNPFSNNCTNCNALKFALYTQIYQIFNGTSNIGTYLSVRLKRIEQASQSNVNPSTFASTISCAGGTCGADIDRKYRLSYRNTSCPCQSWQVHEDTDDNGTYETLVLEAAGWTGICL